MESNVSTVAFRSNLYPIEKSFYEDSVFRAHIHDPFSLEILNKQYTLTSIQENEYDYASVHCAYAEEDDYPWGTVTDTEGHEQVVCRCLNTKCHRFQSCRPDFQPAELTIHEENQKALPAVFEFEEAVRMKPKAEAGDAKAAAKLFSEDNLIASMPVAEVPAEQDDPFVVQKRISATPKPVIKTEINYSSFVETTQDHIIEAEPTERSIVNAGPGTGKTWTLIEKIIYMINQGQAEAENILVLCFSRSAVEVVRSRLAQAAESGRVGYEWQAVDVRSFDSFATYLLAWVQDNCKELLPRYFQLEACDYDQRIKLATTVFKQKKDILADYEHIIVDEVQDLVGSRAELVLAMLKGLYDTCGFTILGDSCQALYDYMAEGNLGVMSSEQFYQDIFKSFPDANYYALTKNHRQADAFGLLTIPYRKAILTGSEQDRVFAAAELLKHIPQTPVKLTRFSRSDALQYIGQGETLGILTRTNGQALQISAWLQNADVPHALHRGLGSPTLGDWIARVFCDYENESVDEAAFVAKYLALYPHADYETARMRWSALISTQNGEAKRRYEVSALLKGLLRNASEPALYEAGLEKKHAITVSNIHRAKGREFDTVIVIDDVIEAMADLNTEDILEHKVSYVALTRPRKKVERAEISKKDKQIYITKNEDHSKRCAKAGGHKRYITHFEVGGDDDLDLYSLADDEKRQQQIRNGVQPGMRLKLIKCPQGTKPYVVYRIVAEDDEKFILGQTSASFAHELEKAIQHIKNMNCQVYFDVYPHAFCDVYVHGVTTCVTGLDSVPAGAKSYGDVSIWSGIAITGFAAVDKDTY